MYKHFINIDDKGIGLTFLKHHFIMYMYSLAFIYC